MHSDPDHHRQKPCEVIGVLIIIAKHIGIHVESDHHCRKLSEFIGVLIIIVNSICMHKDYDHSCTQRVGTLRFLRGCVLKSSLVEGNVMPRKTLLTTVRATLGSCNVGWHSDSRTMRRLRAAAQPTSCSCHRRADSWACLLASAMRAATAIAGGSTACTPCCGEGIRGGCNDFDSILPGIAKRRCWGTAGTSMSKAYTLEADEWERTLVVSLRLQRSRPQYLDSKTR